MTAPQTHTTMMIVCSGTPPLDSVQQQQLLS